MKHPNKKRVPSSLAGRGVYGKLIKIKPNTPITDTSSISCSGATINAYLTTTSEGEQFPKVYHSIVVNGKLHNADNQKDIVGMTFSNGNTVVNVGRDSNDGRIYLYAYANSANMSVKVKLIPPNSPEIANNITGISPTGNGVNPNNPTLVIDEDTKVVTVCILSETPT